MTTRASEAYDGSGSSATYGRPARVKSSCASASAARASNKHVRGNTSTAPAARARIITSRILMARFLCFPSGSLLLLLLFFSSSGAASQESSSPTRQLWNQFHRRDGRTTDLFGFLLSAVRALLLSAQFSQIQIQQKKNYWVTLSNVLAICRIWIQHNDGDSRARFFCMFVALQRGVT